MAVPDCMRPWPRRRSPPSRPVRRRTLARAGLLIAVVLAIATVVVAIVEGAARRRPRRLADLPRRRGHRRHPAAHRGRHRHGVAAFVIYNLLFTEPRYTLIVSDPTRVAQPRPVPVRRARHRAAGGDRRGPRGRGRVACRRVRGAVRDHAHPRRRRPGHALPAVARSLVADAGMDRVWCILDDGGAERTRRRHGRRADRARAARRPGADGRPRRARLGADAPAPTVGGRRGTTDARGRAPAAGGLRTGSEHRYKVRLEAGRRGRSVPCGGRAPPTGPSRRARETRLLALAAAQVGAGRRPGAAAPAGPRRRGRPPRRGAEERARRLRVPRPAHAARRHSRRRRHARGSRATSASPEEVRATATLIEDETKRLDRMVGGLLDLSRIQAGEIKPDREALDVEDAVRTRARRGWRPVVGPRHVEVDIQRDLPPVAGDAAFVDQCLANLVENVARHTPETATAWIRAHPLDDGGPLGRGDRGRGRRAGRRRRGRAAPVRALLPGSRGAAAGRAGWASGSRSSAA